MSNRDTETHNREIENRNAIRRRINDLRRELRASERRLGLPIPWQTEAILDAERERRELDSPGAPSEVYGGNTP